MSPDQRPLELHLCAAAATATEVGDRLQHLCHPSGGRLYHHFSKADEALTTGFVLASGGEPALGAAPLPASLEFDAASSHDASPYLGVAPHAAYRKSFDQLATGAMRGGPPPALSSWVMRQQLLLRRTVARMVEKLATGADSSHAAAKSLGRRAKLWLRSRRGRERQRMDLDPD